MRLVGASVIGLTIMPLSERFTRSTSERLLLDRQVLVDDAEAAVLRHGDGQLDSVTVSIAALRAARSAGCCA